MRKRVALAVLASVLCLQGVPTAAQPADELRELRKDVDALRESHKALESELQAIKQQLRRPQATRPAPQETLAEPVTLTLDGAPTLGTAGARLALVEFSDYQCPFCARHVRQTKPQIVKEYVETGKLQYVLRDLPIASIHPGAPKAHEAAHCAGEHGKYWAMHDRLFSNPHAQGAEELSSQARALGLDPAQFEQCLASARHAARVQEGVEAAQSAGVRATPTFFLGVVDGGTVKATRVIRGALPYPVFKAALDELLESLK